LYYLDSKFSARLVEILNFVGKSSLMKRIITIIIIILLVFGCRRPLPDDHPLEYDDFILYTGKDSVFEDGIRMVAVHDRIVKIPSDADLQQKLSMLADSLSFYYFNNLLIRIKDFRDDNVAEIELVEPDGFKGPGSLPPYRNWYDFFQGSHGGRETSIRLQYTFLQPNYEGQWIEDIEFTYQGQPLEDFDHIILE
jgi:hypothetical protein